MNTILILAGILCILTGAIRALNEKAPPAPPSPEHGEKRIMQIGGLVWMECYNAFPGWSRLQSYSSLEEAQKDKALWDELRKGAVEVK